MAIYKHCKKVFLKKNIYTFSISWCPHPSSTESFVSTKYILNFLTHEILLITLQLYTANNNISIRLSKLQYKIKSKQINSEQ